MPSPLFTTFLTAFGIISRLLDFEAKICNLPYDDNDDVVMTLSWRDDNVMITSGKMITSKSINEQDGKIHLIVNFVSKLCIPNALKRNHAILFSFDISSYLTLPVISVTNSDSEYSNFGFSFPRLETSSWNAEISSLSVVFLQRRMNDPYAK